MGTVAGHRLGALEGGGTFPPSNASLGWTPPPLTNGALVLVHATRALSPAGPQVKELNWMDYHYGHTSPAMDHRLAPAILAAVKKYRGLLTPEAVIPHRLERLREIKLEINKYLDVFHPHMLRRVARSMSAEGN